MSGTRQTDGSSLEEEQAPVGGACAIGNLAPTSDGDIAGAERLKEDVSLAPPKLVSQALGPRVLAAPVARNTRVSLASALTPNDA